MKALKNLNDLLMHEPKVLGTWSESMANRIRAHLPEYLRKDDRKA
jgi:hypothetical protein